MLRKTENAFLSGNYNEIPDLLRNKSNLPDGSSLYGIVFHTGKPAVGGFNKNHEDNYKSSNITLKNIVIKELHHKVIERISLQKEDEEKTKNFTGGQVDPRGSFFNILDFTNKNGSYKSNPIGNAQLLVSKYKKCLLKNKKLFRKKRLYHTNTKRDSISKNVISWSENKNSILQAKFICNADQMLHSIKGTIPLRLSGISKVVISNLKITKIINETPFGSKICGNYRASTSFNNNKPGFLGADVKGVTIESCSDVKFDKIDVEKMLSKSGTVFGMEVMFRNTGIRGDLHVKELLVTKWKDLPNDFYMVPQCTPVASSVLIGNDAKVDILVDSGDEGRSYVYSEKFNWLGKNDKGDLMSFIGVSKNKRRDDRNHHNNYNHYNPHTHGNINNHNTHQDHHVNNQNNYNHQDIHHKNHLKNHNNFNHHQNNNLNNHNNFNYKNNHKNHNSINYHNHVKIHNNYNHNNNHNNLNHYNQHNPVDKHSHEINHNLVNNYDHGINRNFVNGINHVNFQRSMNGIDNSHYYN